MGALTKVAGLSRGQTRRGLIVVILGLSVAGLAAQDGAVSPSRLRCEYLTDPAGIDETRPRLSWELKPADPSRRALRQSAYRILVASTEELIGQDRGDLWDSGKVASEETAGIEYSGKPLESRMRCYWKVKVWDQDAKESAWSPPALWSMGLLRKEDWQAKWISAPMPHPRTTTHWGYRSLPEKSGDVPKWVQIDLGRAQRIDAVRLWGVQLTRNLPPDAPGFPRRFRIEAANNDDFSDARTIADRTSGDVENPGTTPVLLDFAPVEARYIRLTATRLTGVFGPQWNQAKESWEPVMQDRDYRLELAEMEVLSKGTNVARNMPVSATDSVEDVQDVWSRGWSRANLTDGRVEADPGSEYHLTPVTMFRRDVTVAKTVKRATLYATALGSYEIFLNGVKVGDHELAPGWTIYSKRVLYQTYDATSLVKPGANTLGALLADGWYRMRLPFAHMGAARGWINDKRFALYLGPERRWLLAQLEIEYSDGSRDVVGTDRQWRSHADGPIRSTAMFDGVLEDARKDAPGWDRPGFKASEAWRPSDEKPVGDSPILSAQMMEPMRVFQTFKAAPPKEPKPRVYVYDFGQHFAGVCRITLDGPAGTTVRLRHAEVLNPDGTIYTGNLMGAFDNHDTYILDGKGPRTFRAPFVYHGFRYVEVTGVSSPGAVKDIEGLAIASDTPRAASFESSDPRLNKLWDLIYWAYRSNMVSLATDVAARDERNPWLGDCMTDEIYTLSTVLDAAAFGANENRVIVDSLNEHGVPPPQIRGDDEFALRYRSRQPAEAGWADASIKVPHTLWRNYADRRALELGYAGASRFMDEVARRNPDHVPTEYYRARFGDWLSARMTIPPGATDWSKMAGKGAPADLFAAAFWAYSAERVSEMAAALGKPAESARYADMAAKVRQAFVRNHVREDGTIGNGEQSCYAFALGMNHLPPALRARALPQLLKAIDAHKQSLATGSISTIFLLNFLSENGHHDLAYHLVMQPDCPSYGFMVDNGATAMWERFDGYHPKLGLNPQGMNGFNHLGMNSVGEWILSHVAGLQPDITRPGWKHFVVAQKKGGGLDWVKAAYPSLRGTIEVRHESQGAAYTLSLLVPPGTTATVELPGRDVGSITESSISVSEAKGVQFLGRTGACLRFKVESGSYRFVAEATGSRSRP